MDVYALTVGKDGSKLRQVSPSPKHGTNSSPGHLSGQSVSLQDIAIALGAHLDRPVKDFTGLQGSFSFDMSYTFDPHSFADMLKAAEEQLGLKLESTRAYRRLCHRWGGYSASSVTAETDRNPIERVHYPRA
jgi:uncharacterized protein (TIGR03435 family)